MGGQRHAPAPLLPGNNRYPLYRKEAGEAPGPVWTGAEILRPPGFDPCTVQPVVSRYPDWAIPEIFKYLCSVILD